MCHCPKECDEVEYSVQYSTTNYPAEFYHTRGDRGSLGQKIHFTAYFCYELAILNTQYTCLYLYMTPTFEAL